MQSSGIPAKFPIPFAADAGPDFVRPIPVASQISSNPGYASLTDGFPPLNFTPVASGGIPPFGQDMNGILQQLSAWAQWQAAGGPSPFDPDFSSAIGGYPKGAVVASAVSLGVCFMSLADNNTSNPDSGGANWKAFSPVGAAAAADYSVDSGAANALVIAPAPAVAAYADGLSFVVSPAHANTGATTLKVGSLAAKPIVHVDGSDPLSGEIQAGQLMRVAYRGGAFQWLNPPYAPTRSVNDNSTFPASTAYADRAAANAAGSVDTFGGFIFGLQMAPTPATPTTAVTVSVGACRDSTNSKTISLSAPINKLLTATWVAGDGNGGRFVSTPLAAGQTWFEFVIENPTTGVVDAGFDQSPTAPTLPAGFTVFRRIGAVVLDAAAATIRPFFQNGDYFGYVARSTDYAAVSQGSAAPAYRPVATPFGIPSLAELYFQSNGTADSGIYLSGVYAPQRGTPTFGGPTQLAQIRRGSVYTYPGTWVSYQTVICYQWTDATAHVYTATTDTAELIALGVIGWWDLRGKYY